MNGEFHKISNKFDFNEKDVLYAFFYELIGKIKGCKVDIDEIEYQKNIETIPTITLINYIKDTIQILLKKEIDKNEKIFEYKNKNNLSLDEITIKQYENIIRKLEEKVRYLTSVILKNKLQKNSLESQLDELFDIEREYEEMKIKFKYENGTFLNNDRKENEINILRKENINLKNYIYHNEEKWKKQDEELITKENIILSLNLQIEKFKNKIKNMEKEFNIFTNYNKLNNSDKFNIKYILCNLSNNMNTINLISKNKKEFTSFKFSQFEKIKTKLFKKKYKSGSNSLSRNETLVPKKLQFFKNYLNSKNNVSCTENNKFYNTKIVFNNLKANINTSRIFKNNNFNTIQSYRNLLKYNLSSRKLTYKQNNDIYKSISDDKNINK